MGLHRVLKPYGKPYGGIGFSNIMGKPHGGIGF